jgi:hypothetical protein
MKIKIDKKIWLIIGIAILIAAVVGLVRIYRQQGSEQDELRTSLATEQGLLHMLTTQENDQQDKLKQAESLLDASRAKFPESVESIEYGEDLFKIAHNCNVELISLSPSMPGTKTGGAVTYSVSSFAIQVSGNVNDILDFINALRIGDGFQLPWSAEVKSVSTDIGDQGAVATINVDIYGYKG